MKRVAYLMGAGAVQAEMALGGIESDTTMSGISQAVLRMSEETDGEYSRLVRDFGLPSGLDVELIMSLFEDIVSPGDSAFPEVNRELRSHFRSYLVSQIAQMNVIPRISSCLLHINKEYGRDMGRNGEKIDCVLTTNYDGLLEEAFARVYGGLNCGHEFRSDDFTMNTSLPPLLKLHGSFNWKVDEDRLEVSRDFETREGHEDDGGWIPPSVYKRPPEGVIGSIWRMARSLLSECDVLRVIGSSLRNEDWALISLVFTSQLRSAPPLSIELVVPDRSALGDETAPGIMQRLRFLGRVRNLSSLPVFEREEFIGDNVFHHWLVRKIGEVESNNDEASEDEFINDMLYRG